MTTEANLNNNPKIPLIIDSTLTLLREKGDQGLSMRQVASRSGMSLGNLQYYFKNMNELLKGVVSFYFEECGASFIAKMEEVKTKIPKEQVIELINYGLGYSEKENKTFHQLWAIANNNEEVQAHLKSYYVGFSDNLSDILSPIVIDKDSVPVIISLLLPYFEGYLITSFVTPLDKAKVSEMLLNIILPMIKDE